ncbi:unnamed protein product [Dibothriocephalus latus]|uniref:DUF7041 domain-containing protein n=1 Tax=Dibothriocephalus latus TaxID=60516 RepID=A0A3P7LNV4_DIBLA|nr:unnamed protein product [Dibothriocephalus latus]
MNVAECLFPTTADSSRDQQTFTLPEFWPQNVSTWFAAVDALFTSEGITSQWKRFSHLAFALPPGISTDLCGKVLTSNPSAPYDQLKSAVLKVGSRETTPPQPSNRNSRYEVSSEVSRPTRNSRVAANDPEESKREQNFLRRLSHRIQKVSSPRQNEVILEDTPGYLEVGIVGDASDPKPARTLSPEPAPTLRQIQSDILRLQAQVAIISSGRLRRAQSLPRSRQRSKSRRRGLKRQTWCWYHQSFGVNAKMCNHPCQFNTDQAIMASSSF